MKYLALLSCLLILGCGSAEKAEEETETVGKEIAEDLNALQDKASEVADTLKEEAEELEEAIEEATDDL